MDVEDSPAFNTIPPLRNWDAPVEKRMLPDRDCKALPVRLLMVPLSSNADAPVPLVSIALLFELLVVMKRISNGR